MDAQKKQAIPPGAAKWLAQGWFWEREGTAHQSAAADGFF